jgi:hypothetical protein
VNTCRCSSEFNCNAEEIAASTCSDALMFRPLLQPGVPSHPDARQLGNLLTPQTRRAATVGTGQPDVEWAQSAAPVAQELAQFQPGMVERVLMAHDRLL